MGKILFSLLLLCCLSVTAGEVHYITTDAQYFDPETLELYTPLKKGLYQKTVIAINTNKDFSYIITLNEPVTINLQEYLAARGIPESSLINLKKLKKGKNGYPPVYEPQLKNISFKYDSGTDTDYSEWDLRIIDPDYALMRLTWGDRNDSTSSTRDFYRYASISINNSLALYVIKNTSEYHYNYTIVNTGKGYSMYTSNPNKPVLQETQEDLTSFLRTNYPGCYTFNENGKEGIRTYSTILVPAVYDKIIQTHFNHTIARKGSEIDLYYKNGDRIDLTGIRAVYFEQNISVLKGNEIYYVGREGELLSGPRFEIDQSESITSPNPDINKTRYTKLDNFDKGFARFTLPDGTQGWLAKDGTEYLDQ